MESTIFYKETPIESLLALNTPSYVQQNVYGRMKYYPVVEPMTMIDVKDFTDAHIEQAKKFNSTKDVVEAFFNWNPEGKGQLTDSRKINFLGFSYTYYPNHKTYYGNVDKEYLILPIIARWYACVSAGYNDNDFKEANRLPREYRGGQSKGFKYSVNNTESVGPEVRVNRRDASLAYYVIPMLPPGSMWRGIVSMNIPNDIFRSMDVCFGEVGINTKTQLTGECATDTVQRINVNGTEKFYVATHSTKVINVPNVTFNEVSSNGMVHLYEVTTSDKENPIETIKTAIGG